MILFLSLQSSALLSFLLEGPQPLCLTHPASETLLRKESQPLASLLSETFRKSKLPETFYLILWSQRKFSPKTLV